MPCYPNFYQLLLPFAKFCQLSPLLNNFYTTFTNYYYFLWPFANFYLILIFIVLFINQKWVLFLSFFYFHLLIYSNSSILLNATLLELMLCLSGFYMPWVVYIYQLNHKSNMNNSFRIIIVKVNIVKVNIIKIYVNKTHIITK